MAYYAQKDPDLEATEKIYRKIMSTGRDPGRSYATPTPHTSPGRKYVPPTPRRNKGTRQGYSRGGGAQTDTQMNRHFPDPSEALKRTYDGSSPHRGISPASTARTGPSVSSKRRAVTNSHSPAKTPTHQQYKKDKHLTGVPCEKKVLDSENLERWNQSYQALRLEKEWTELDQCRNMKRNSEIVRHRVDNMYMMSGSGIRLRPKYDVNEEELRQLKELSRARQKLRDGAMKNQMDQLLEDESQLSSLPPHPTPIPGRHSYTPDTSDSEIKVSPRFDTHSPVKQIPEVAMLSRTESKSPVSRCDSPESGIQADVQREDELQDDEFNDLADLDDIQLEPVDLEHIENTDFVQETHDFEDRPISRIEIRTQSGGALDEADVNVMDILKHHLSTNKDVCMLEIGRQASPRQPGQDQIEDDTPPARQSSSHRITIKPDKGSYTILPFDPYDHKKGKRTAYRCGRGPPVPRKKKTVQNNSQMQQFPVRKPSSRFIVAQSPISCQCRETSYDNFPVLSVNGYQLHLAHRAM